MTRALLTTLMELRCSAADIIDRVGIERLRAMLLEASAAQQA